jgi:hypothetical protein
VIVLRSSFDTQSFEQLQARYLKACASVCKAQAEAEGEGSS